MRYQSNDERMAECKINAQIEVKQRNNDINFVWLEVFFLQPCLLSLKILYEVLLCFVSAEEKEDIEHLQARNSDLISNILPEHVAEHFLSLDKAPDVSTVLYFSSVDQVDP